MSWRHGTRTGYIHHGCRCSSCTAANSKYDRERYEAQHPGALPKRCEVMPGNLSAEPLERIALSRRLAHASEDLGVSRTTWKQWRRVGLSPLAADRIAVRLGHHPIELWSDWYDVQEVNA